MSFTEHEAYMRMAISIAQDGLGRTWPNPTVGCVIVQGGRAIGHGRTADSGRPHAETEALKMAGDAAKGATAYVSLEPCNHHGKTPPCSQALIDAGVGKVYVACEDPDPRTAGQGIAALRAAGIEVELGLCVDLALAVNAGFFKCLRTGTPFVVLKQAVSADGMVAALKSHGPDQRTYISGPEAQSFVHELRATFDAIGVGVNTVLSDNPLLTVRLDGYEHSLVRVVFDSHLRIPLESNLVQTASRDPVWVCYQDASPDTVAALEAAGVKLFQTGRSVQSALEVLGAQGITRLLVEGGPTLHGALLQAGLADQAMILKSPKTIGAGGLKGADFEASGFECIEKRDLGEDLLEIFCPAP